MARKTLTNTGRNFLNGLSDLEVKEDDSAKFFGRLHRLIADGNARTVDVTRQKSGVGFNIVLGLKEMLSYSEVTNLLNSYHIPYDEGGWLENGWPRKIPGAVLFKSLTRNPSLLYVEPVTGGPQ